MFSLAGEKTTHGLNHVIEIEKNQLSESVSTYQRTEASFKSDSQNRKQLKTKFSCF